MTEGKDVSKYFNSTGVVFERTEDGEGFVYVCITTTTTTTTTTVFVGIIARA